MKKTIEELVCDLSWSFEGLDDEITYKEFGCLEASSIIALAFNREKLSSSLVRGPLFYRL